MWHKTVLCVLALLACALAQADEPVSHAYLIGTSGWTDEGWNTITSDPHYVDPANGQRGLNRFSTSVGHKRMLVLFVEFPDRQAAKAQAPYTQMQPYLDYVRPAADWFSKASYGRLSLSLAAPQTEWIMMGKNAADYKWGGDFEDTGDMFNYCRDAVQLAYDRFGIRASDYDLLLIMPAAGKAGLVNGPANINDQYMGQASVPPRSVLVERGGKAHTIDTFVTAGNDLFYWGYRWLVHETGHTFGLPDLYMYKPQIRGVDVDRFFYVGGWDLMGDIHGQSDDYLAWHKWKLRWIDDAQVQAVSRATTAPSRHVLQALETPGGSKMLVVRTAVNAAYVAELRGKAGGVLLYRVDSARMDSTEQPVLQVISKQYYEAVGGPRNLTGLWRPLDKSMDGYGANALWRAGDTFADPATGVQIHIAQISGEAAELQVSKTQDAPLARALTLRKAVLRHQRELEFETELAPVQFEENWFTRQRSRLAPQDLVLTSAGKILGADRIEQLEVEGNTVRVRLKPGSLAAKRPLTLASKAFFNVGAAPAIAVRVAP